MINIAKIPQNPILIVKAPRLDTLSLASSFLDFRV